MFHLIWYVLIGLIAGLIAKSVMHLHMTIFWTTELGVIGSILGGAVTHMFSRPTNERYHPAGLIFSTLGAILVLYICYKLNIHFPRSNRAFPIERPRLGLRSRLPRSGRGGYRFCIYESESHPSLAAPIARLLRGGIRLIDGENSATYHPATRR